MSAIRRPSTPSNRSWWSVHLPIKHVPYGWLLVVALACNSVTKAVRQKKKGPYPYPLCSKLVLRTAFQLMFDQKLLKYVATCVNWDTKISGSEPFFFCHVKIDMLNCCFFCQNWCLTLTSKTTSLKVTAWDVRQYHVFCKHLDFSINWICYQNLEFDPTPI